MLPSIWIVGPAQVGKHQLTKAILPHAESKADAHIWTINTKYYVAEVSIQVIGTDSAACSGSPEALVLVIDATDSSTLQQAQSWVKEHGMDDVEIKLLVANKADLIFSKTSQEVDRPAWLDSAIDWSVNECFEYIETSALHADVDGQLCLDGEKSGTPRVVSALQAHMWPGMKMKDDTRSAALDVGSAPSFPPSQSDAAAKDQTHKSVQESGIDASQSGKDCDDGNDDELEKHVDRFDEILAEMHGARDRFATMPDDKRRAAAAELAMRLASLLDDCDDDEEDSDGL